MGPHFEKLSGCSLCMNFFFQELFWQLDNSRLFCGLTQYQLWGKFNESYIRRAESSKECAPKTFLWFQSRRSRRSHCAEINNFVPKIIKNSNHIHSFCLLRTWLSIHFKWHYLTRFWNDFEGVLLSGKQERHCSFFWHFYCMPVRDFNNSNQ